MHHIICTNTGHMNEWTPEYINDTHQHSNEVFKIDKQKD